MPEDAETAVLRPKHQVRSWHAVVLVIAFLVGVWWFTSADAVDGWTGRPNGSAQVSMDESMYVGYAGLADRPVIATSLTPVVTDGLRASLFFCEPTHIRTEIVGLVDSTTIDSFCELVPVTDSVPLWHDPQDGYPVIEVTRTQPGPQRLCGVEIRYRDGWRWGQTRAAVYDVVFDADEDALEDPTAWPSCPGG